MVNDQRLKKLVPQAIKIIREFTSISKASTARELYAKGAGYNSYNHLVATTKKSSIKIRIDQHSLAIALQDIAKQVLPPDDLAELCDQLNQVLGNKNKTGTLEFTPLVNASEVSEAMDLFKDLCVEYKPLDGSTLENSQKWFIVLANAGGNTSDSYASSFAVLYKLRKREVLRRWMSINQDPKTGAKHMMELLDQNVSIENINSDDLLFSIMISQIYGLSASKAFEVGKVAKISPAKITYDMNELSDETPIPDGVCGYVITLSPLDGPGFQGYYLKEATEQSRQALQGVEERIKRLFPSASTSELLSHKMNTVVELLKVPSHASVGTELLSVMADKGEIDWYLTLQYIENDKGISSQWSSIPATSVEEARSLATKTSEFQIWNQTREMMQAMRKMGN